MISRALSRTEQSLQWKTYQLKAYSNQGNLILEDNSQHFFNLSDISRDKVKLDFHESY